MNKEMDLSQAVAQLSDGMTIGVGGWGPRRKPMALIREILRSGLRDLTLVCYGGPEVGMLCAAGKVKKLIYGFVSLDRIPLEPYFRKAREAGQVEVAEWDEGLFLLGLRAAAEGIPFTPTRVGLGTDILTYNPGLRTVNSPYPDGEVLIAMPAIKPDISLIHVSRADRKGNTQTDGPDPYFDHLFARAAGRVIVTAEEVVDRLDLTHSDRAKANLFDRYLVKGVVHAPCGAHPTTAHEAYGWDMKHLAAYAATAAEEGGWDRYMSEYIAGGEAAYLDRVGGRDAVARLPIPLF
ncbi:MAG: acyl CoA--acetate/3-ketoacid CoA transferase subunit alpha [Rhodovulum sulfidophilum]|uniref:Acyl CoA--acetate/3-ketoacid CoA transferase subunit alpha n=1 Tax=Rhodovulum sulfidophilum TaxID=35806 RepID=A0A2W5N231_RHOSU|nr:MAG: acyl CoA--acetate/3-ketoacid CoA transferase subunit alpha [Rhodovulum sulfidophilum]